MDRGEGRELRDPVVVAAPKNADVVRRQKRRNGAGTVRAGERFVVLKNKKRTGNSECYRFAANLKLKKEGHLTV